MTWPPVGIETSTPSAICGSRPMATNSVVPMANPPMASASTARVKWRVDPNASAGAVAVVVIAGTASRRPRLFRASAHVGSAQGGQRLVERRRGAHHGRGLLGVGAVVATDVGRLPLDTDQLLGDGLLVVGQAGGQRREGRREPGVVLLPGQLLGPVESEVEV